MIKKDSIILFILFVSAFALRVYGIYPGFPNVHPDEGASYHTTVNMFYNYLGPNRFDYPAGVPFLNLLFYIAFFIPPIVLQLLLRDPFALLSGPDFFIQNKETIFGPWNLHALYWTRGITALFGAGSVVLVYFAARNLFNKYVGLFSSLFLSVNYLHIVRSHFGLPDVYNSFFLALILFICSKLLRKDSFKNYLYAGIIGGAAFSLKYQIFVFLPFFLTHFFIIVQRRKPLMLFRRQFLFSLFLAGLTFLVLNPYYLFNISDALSQNANDVRRYQMGNTFLRPYAYYYLYNWGIGQLASIAIVLGMVFMLFKSPKNWLLLMSFVFPFFFFMTYYSQGGIFTRNFANVMPALMIFAGFFAGLLYKFFCQFNKLYANIAITAVLLIANFVPIKNSVILDMSYAQQWNVNVLADFLESSLPKDVTVRYYQLFLPQKGMDAFVSKHTTQKDWDYSNGPNSLAEFQEENTDFAILNTNPLQAITYWWRGYPELYMHKSTMPFDYIENSFHGLSIKELLNYTVFEAYKPWQSHYENNYLVFKIPEPPKTLGKRIANFPFDSKESLWELRGALGFGSMNATWRGGEIVASSSGTSSRLGSSATPIKEGLLYTVEGNIKTNKIEYGERDGFLRIDFYKDNKKQTLENMGVNVAISARAPATAEWTKVRASIIAPKGTKFMTVSFQFKNAYFTSVLDDVEVFESNSVPSERFKDVPYIKSTIPIESLYYNTFI